MSHQHSQHLRNEEQGPVLKQHHSTQNKASYATGPFLHLPSSCVCVYSWCILTSGWKSRWPNHASWILFFFIFIVILLFLLSLFLKYQDQKLCNAPSLTCFQPMILFWIKPRIQPGNNGPLKWGNQGEFNEGTQMCIGKGRETNNEWWSPCLGKAILPLTWRGRGRGI